MAKGVGQEVAEFFLSGFGIADFLFKGTGGGSKQGYSPRRGGSSRPMRSTPFFSSSNSSSPSLSSKQSKNNYNKEELNRVMTNAKKARMNLGGLKTGYAPKQNKSFSGLR